MNGIQIHVHFPKIIFFCHTGKIGKRVFPLLLNKLKQVGMRHAGGTTASPGKAKEVTAGNRFLYINMLNETVVEEGNIDMGGQGITAVIIGSDLNAA